MENTRKVFNVECILRNVAEKVEHIFVKNLFTHFSLLLRFQIETSHLICTANQLTGFYMKCNTGLKWVNLKCKLNRGMKMKNWVNGKG